MDTETKKKLFQCLVYGVFYIPAFCFGLVGIGFVFLFLGFPVILDITAGLFKLSLQVSGILIVLAIIITIIKGLSAFSKED